MEDEVPGGWLTSVQPRLLTVAAATLQSKLRRDRKPRARAAPLWVRGAGGAEGAGGRDECNIGRAKNNTAPRPVPPARPGPRNPAPYHLGLWSPGTGGALGSWGHLRGAPEPGRARKGEERRGAPVPGEGHFPTPKQCARLLFKYSD